jgi:hypothetical protein
MTDKLKKFVNKHKQEFDTEEPRKDLWDKIDARMEKKNSSWISSTWLSRLKYLGLSASVLIIAAYLITEKMGKPSSNELAQNLKDSAVNNSGEWMKANQNKSEMDQVSAENEKSNNADRSMVSSGKSVNENGSEIVKQDTVIVKPAESIVPEPAAVKEEKTIVANEKKENTSVVARRKGISIPAEPVKENVYTGTLYDNVSLCSLIHLYKFPGKVSMDGGNYTDHQSLKTVSCNRLGKLENLKAVWVKGRTSKKLKLEIADGFENMVLVKSDGKEIHPEAISHYYSGSGLITGYGGKHFEMIFKEKFDLLLFFKDVEEGDKIKVDGVIETIVSKP